MSDPLMRNRDSLIPLHGGYRKLLIWSPSIVGFALPIGAFIGVLLATSGWQQLHRLFFQETEEIVPLLTGAAINTVPFGLASLLTKQDLASGLAYRKILIRWLVRVVPVLAWYLFLLVSIIIASVKGLPGASTSPIALLTVPLFGVPAVLLSHWIIDKLQEG
ncbi:MAG: hypothetical protein HGB21_09950 [Nitrospirae bacterium]|nr:hypothetical protein [Nitrospirota bacterium]